MNPVRNSRGGEREAAAVLSIRVQPRSSETGVAGIMDDGTIKVRLNAPPVEGKANEALIAYLADILDIKKSAIEIKSGHSARLKVLKIEGLSQETVTKRIQELIK
jgi:uncharacterized protein (TIGR00251 family)